MAACAANLYCVKLSAYYAHFIFFVLSDYILNATKGKQNFPKSVEYDDCFKFFNEMVLFHLHKHIAIDI